jgi:hypothetical protein
MSHQTVLKIKKASFQAGTTTIRSKQNIREDGSLMGDYIVGNEGLDLEVTVQEGWIIKTETYITVDGYQAVRVYTDKK